jgi:GNAT superfamily N-acetyltransferase
MLVIPVGWAAVFREGRRARKPQIQIYVLPAHRRQGVGTKLVARLLERERLLDVSLWLWHDSRVAARFYEACGFS